MPLTPCFFTNTGSIPVGATKLKAKEHKSSKMKLWRFRLVARTHASHAWNTGSIPVGATSSKLKSIKLADILKLWRFRLVARTHASHAWNTGSIPVGATSVRTLSGSNFFFLPTGLED